MIIICKCVANKHQKLKNFVLDCNKVNKEKALNKWLYFCKRMVYMYKTVVSKLSISHIAWHNKEAWCYDKNESYMVNAPTTTTTVTTKIYFEWIKKVFIPLILPWNYQVTNILYIVFFYDKLLRSIHCWSFPSFLHHR